MKVFLTPPSHLSRAMFRVATALTAYKPSHVHIVTTPAEADLYVLHVTGHEGMPELVEELRQKGQKFAILQYCLKTAGGALTSWESMWRDAKCVLSYYNLGKIAQMDNFYYTPLGVDPVFAGYTGAPSKSHGVMTSGYVSGHGAEAIEEATLASTSSGWPTLHLGPAPTRMTVLPEMKLLYGISDEMLARYYAVCHWVSGLRHVEGFELPALEGLVCGARPVLFDREEMRHWYGDHAVYVPECEGIELVERLREVFSTPRPVSAAERAEVVKEFNWAHIASGFWDRVLV